MKPILKVDAEKFSAQVKRWASRKAPAAHKRAGKALFFELLRLVIDKTPVDTGRARGGFGAGAEALGIPVPDSGSAEYAEGKAQSEFKQSAAMFHIRLSVINKVAYIELLEDGSSTQAPFGMYRISMRELEHRLGGRQIPPGILAIYRESWNGLGLAGGSELRAGQIAEALGAELTHGSGGLT